MSKKHMTWKWVGVCCVLVVSIGAHAELNLWVAYHYAGMEACKMGHYADAEELLAEAKAVLESPKGKVCKKDRIRLACTLDGLGMAAVSRGNYEQGEGYYEEALRLKKKALGKNSREVPRTLNNIANLHYILGNNEDVKDLYTQALDIHRGDQLNIEVCRSLNGVALLHHAAGEYVEAEDLLLRAVEIHKKAQRREHPYLATNLINLGVLYTELERYDEAQCALDWAKRIQDIAVGAEHPDVAVRTQAEAVLCSKTGCQAEALALQAKADAIREKFAQLNAAE